jgi:protein O-GlcNAc transferase
LKNNSEKIYFDALLNEFNKKNIKNFKNLALLVTKKFPHHIVGWKALGTAYTILENYVESLNAFKKAVEISDQDAEIFYNLGIVYTKLGKLIDAELAYKKSITISPNNPNALNNLGNTLSRLNKLDEAVDVFENLLKIDPSNLSSRTQLIYEYCKICEFKKFDENLKLATTLGISSNSVDPNPFLSLIDNPDLQFQRAKKFAIERFRQSSQSLSIKPSILPTKIRIGYFSADFHNFPGMYLMTRMLELHNREEFEIFAFSYGPDKNDEMRKRIVLAVDHFIDISKMSIRDTIRCVRKNKIDIAIHRNGYTKNSKTEIFQYRIAPIQINYLGYPGTLGADFIDYIIADKNIIPQDKEQFYLEKIIYMPHCYQPNDDTRKIPFIDTKREDFNLPKNAFVLCSFNQSYKINPNEFRIWMKILKKVNNSVLWLLKSNKWAIKNLEKSAELNGIDPKRIIFAEKLNHIEHLSRHKHADLFVDTFNYNAHTTASDALWAGLPLVTKIGKQFSARVAASLLITLDLSELVAQTEEEYENLIYELATNPKKLKFIKKKLITNIKTKPLFDSQRYTKYFEKGLKEVYKNYFYNHTVKNLHISED